MTNQPRVCVADASVAIKLVVIEPLSDRADALFDQLAADPPAQFYVPDLFFVECANILWKHVRRYGYPAESARQDLAGLCDLALRAVSTADLVAEALVIALAYDITAYDACYVALADQIDAPLITADEALARKLAGTGHDVRWLGEASAPPLPDSSASTSP